MSDNNNIFRAGRIRLDLAREQLQVDGEPVSLRRKPLLLLHALMSRPRALVTKRELIEVGWGDVPVTDAVLTTAIKEVRRALGDDARSPFAVENVHGRGYRFLLDVVAEPAAPDDSEGHSAPATGEVAPREQPSPAPPSPMPSAPQPEASRSTPATPTAGQWIDDRRDAARGAWLHGKRRLGVVLALAPFLVAALLTASHFLRGALSGDPAAAGVAGNTASDAPAIDAPPAIAVLPLDDMSPGGDRGWFADGLTEEILNELAKSPRLRVASRTSTFRFRGAQRDLRGIADELGVDYVMEGSVRTARERLRITLQLIRANDGLHVFSESWDRSFELDSVLAVQREISRKVFEALDAALAGTDEAAAGASATSADLDLAAYEDFLRGRELVYTRTPDSLREGLDLLLRSAQAAPDFAPTQAALATGILLSAQFAGSSFEAERERAAARMRVATALAPQSPDVLLAGSLLAMAEGDPKRSLELADAAARNAPSAVEAHYRRGLALTMLGQQAEALEAFRRASLLDPLAPAVNGSLAISLLANAEPAQALEVARRALRWNPDHVGSLHAMASALSAIGNYGEACDLLSTALELTPGAFLLGMMRGELLWRLGADDLLLSRNEQAESGARAAVLLSSGDAGSALAIAREYRGVRSFHLDAFDIAYWAREPALAQELAVDHPEGEQLRNHQATMAYRREIHQAIMVLDDAPLVATLRAVVERRFEDWQPPADGPVLEVDLLGAAASRVLEGDRTGALGWLELAADRGFVLRELHLDPLFDELRDDPRFLAVLSRMEQTAARHRDRLTADAVATTCR